MGNKFCLEKKKKKPFDFWIFSFFAKDKLFFFLKTKETKIWRKKKTKTFIIHCVYNKMTYRYFLFSSKEKKKRIKQQSNKIK